MKSSSNTQYILIKKLFLLVIVIILYWPNSGVFAQEGLGLPIIRNFTPKEYQAEVRNWCMVQDNRGVLFIGNNAGVLKFDGNIWRLIPINNTIVRSLAIDKNNRIYVGAQGEIGYLEANEQGKLEYISLLNLLEPSDRNFTDVWSTLVKDDTIYFHTVSKIFQLVGNTFKTFNTNYSYHRSFIINNSLYVRQDELGLTRLEGEKFKPIPGGDIFDQEYIPIMLPLGDKILIGSRTLGLFIYDPRTPSNKNPISPFDTEVSDYIKYHSLYCGAINHVGNIVLGTITGGVVEISASGEKINVYDEKAGLENNSVFFVYPERNNNLIVLSNGISIIETNSPLTVWGKGQGLRGSVLSSLWHEGVLYAGTADGLFFLDNESNQFRKIEGVGVQCWQLKSYTDSRGETSLLAATTFGLFEVQNKLAYQIDKGRAFSLIGHPTKQDLTIVGQEGTVLIVQKIKGKWKTNKILILKDNLFWSIAFDNDENLWLGTEIHGFVKIQNSFFSIYDTLDFIDPINILIYDTLKGLPSLSKTYLFNIENKICAATAKGVIAYNKQTDRFETENDIFIKLGSGRRVYQLGQDSQGNVWFDSDQGKGVLRKVDAHNWQLDEIGLRRLPPLPEFVSNRSVIYTSNDIVWYGCAEGLFRYNPNFKKNYTIPFNALIRSVTVNDTTLFWGNGYSEKPLLKYSQNKFSFSYSAAFYEGGEYNQFSYMLDGIDKTWSSWTYKTEKEYNYLPFGDYTFNVKAKNIFGQESKIESYSFKILPPWYFNWWMYPLYVVSFAALVLSIVTWRVKRLNKEKFELERLIEEKTKEIKAQNEELQIQKEEILSQRDHLETKNQLLEESRKIIGKQNIELESAVEKRTVELAEANHELSERYRQLEQFSFIAAHNLRAPVARILGLISILDKDNLAQPSNSEIIEKLVSSSKDLDSVISDLGAIVNLQRGNSLEYKEFDCNEALVNIIKPYQEEIQKFNIIILTNVTAQKIYTIPVYFTSIMSNLISNAIKYKTEKYQPKIKIEIIAFTDHYQLIIEDNGIGFDSEKFAEKLFNPFQRFHTHNDGKGLGMYLIKTQVKALNGSINLKSKVNVGTRVEIILPVHSPNQT